MKFFASVFLHVLGSFSLIKIVHSLDCYQISAAAFVGGMKDCPNRVIGEISKDDSEDEMASKLFACIRKSMKQESVTCVPEATNCLTLTLELKDQTQIMVKGCGESGSGDCEHVKARLTSAEQNDYVKASHCDYCSSNNCNNQKPKSDPHLSSPSAVSAPPAAAVLITVLITHILL